ncbi:MAG: PEP/pyruvate-binding domain-containing protein [Desulfurivibrionaceae bacterium]
MGDVGGKANNLVVLKASGLPVPEFFVIDHAQLCSTLDQSQLEQLLSTIGKGYFDKRDQEEIADLINGVRLESILSLKTIADFIGTFELFAVRSSNSLEDGKHASWAGIFESVLKVKRSNISAAVRRCWASAFTEVSYLYCTQVQKRAFSDLNANIIIQRMVSSKVAGVAFSKNPATDRDQGILVEYVEGIGDILVSGHVNPKRINLIRNESPADVDLPFPAGQLVEGIVAIERLLHCPVDIEWAWDGSTLYFLQARPMTALIL